VSTRTSERRGWIFGLLGGFVWIPILAFVVLARGQTPEGIAGLLIATLAACVVVERAPWRWPSTPYWQLMVPVYLVFAAGIAWAVWAVGRHVLGLSWWSLPLLMPVLLPFWLIGRRRWDDGGSSR